jgi:hypothetical protein
MTTAAPRTDAVEAAALARLYGYLGSFAVPVSEHDETIARDAFVRGFRLGAAWSLRTCTELATQLAQPALKDGVDALHSLLVSADEADERLAEVRSTLQYLRELAERDQANSWTVIEHVDDVLQKLGGEQGK